MVDGMGNEWDVRTVTSTSIDELCRILRPGASLSQHVLIPWHEWTAVLTNGPLGTDVGMLPSLAARQLGCNAIRATATAPAARFPAVVLEVYDPAAADILRCRRAISAANDGGRWAFAQSGEPFAFEQLDTYTSRRVIDRFTPTMLHEYLGELGVPADLELDVSRALSVGIAARQ